MNDVFEITPILERLTFQLERIADYLEKQNETQIPKYYFNKDISKEYKHGECLRQVDMPLNASGYVYPVLSAEEAQKQMKKKNKEQLKKLKTDMEL